MSKEAKETKPDEIETGVTETADSGVESVPDDSAQVSPDTAPPAKRGRGRPAGSGAKTGAKPGPKSSAKAKADVSRIGKQIMGIHMLAASFTGLPELVISQQEGEMLADAVVNVAEEYGLSFSGKTGAAVQLFAAVAMVYAPRAIAISRRAQTTAQHSAQSNQNASGGGFGAIVPNGINGESIQ